MLLRYSSLLAIIALVSLYGEPVRADEKSFAKAQNECFVELKLTVDEMQLIKTEKVYDQDTKTVSKSLQCFPLCFYKHLGMIGADNKYNDKLILESLAEYYKGDQKKSTALLEKCNAGKKGNECEMAYNYAVCAHNE